MHPISLRFFLKLMYLDVWKYFRATILDLHFLHIMFLLLFCIIQKLLPCHSTWVPGTYWPHSLLLGKAWVPAHPSLCSFGLCLELIRCLPLSLAWCLLEDLTARPCSTCRHVDWALRPGVICLCVLSAGCARHGQCLPMMQKQGRTSGHLELSFALVCFLTLPLGRSGPLVPLPFSLLLNLLPSHDSTVTELHGTLWYPVLSGLLLRRGQILPGDDHMVSSYISFSPGPSLSIKMFSCSPSLFLPFHLPTFHPAFCIRIFCFSRSWAAKICMCCMFCIFPLVFLSMMYM